MPLRFALFDMDDVLCRYDVDARVARLATLSGLAPEVVKSRIWENDFLDVADRGRWSAQAFLAAFNARLGATISRDDWVAARRDAMQPYGDVLDLVRRVAMHHPVALFTNNDHVVRETLDTLFPALRPIFGDRMLVSADLGVSKPDPEAFRAACARLGFDPSLTFFTDDRPENVAGAEAAGLTGHVFDGFEGLAAALRTHGLTS